MARATLGVGGATHNRAATTKLADLYDLMDPYGHKQKNANKVQYNVKEGAGHQTGQFGANICCENYQM